MFAKLGARYRHVRHNHRLGFLLRYVTIAVGVIVTAVGVVAIPLPGPGWAIVFLGLLIMSEELEWAAHLRRWIMTTLNAFYQRFVYGNVLTKTLFGIGSVVVVVVVIWLVDGFRLAGGWVGVEADWLQSPLLH